METALISRTGKKEPVVILVTIPRILGSSQLFLYDVQDGNPGKQPLYEYDHPGHFRL
jgi:hypothetical protein